MQEPQANITDDTLRLQNHVELLEADIDRSKKLRKTQTAEIKRLTVENDNLRRELSKYQGMRKFVTVGSKSCDNDDSTGTTPTTDIQSVQDELTMTQTKLKSLKEHMRDIATSMITSLDDESGFQKVTHRRKRQSRTCDDVTTPSTGTSSQVVGQSIKVIQGGVPVAPTGPQASASSLDVTQRSQRGARQRSYADVTQRSPQPPNRTQQKSHKPRGNGAQSVRRGVSPQSVVIGTSLTRGVGPELTKKQRQCYLLYLPRQPDTVYTKSVRTYFK